MVYFFTYNKILKYHNNIRDVLIYFLGYLSGMFIITLIYRFLLFQVIKKIKEDLIFEIILYIIFSVIIGFLPISFKYLPKFVLNIKDNLIYLFHFFLFNSIIKFIV